MGTGSEFVLHGIMWDGIETSLRPGNVPEISREGGNKGSSISPHLTIPVLHAFVHLQDFFRGKEYNTKLKVVREGCTGNFEIYNVL